MSQKPQPKTAEEAAFDFSKDAGLGLEGMTAADVAIPFLSILQKLSPQLEETNGKYIEGAKAGHVLNTVTLETYDTGKNPIEFVPTYYRRMFPEWKDRTKGGGFVAMHDDPTILTKCSKNERNQDVLPNGNLVVPTAYYFGMLLTGAGPDPAVIAMASSQWVMAKKWNAIILKHSKLDDGRIGPAYRCKYRLSTVLQTNEKGSWYGWQVALAGKLEDRRILEEASAFGRSCKSQALLLTDKAMKASDGTEEPDAF